MTKLSDCGTIKLVGKIFCEDEDKLKLKFGLPIYRKLGQRFCKKCGKEVHGKYLQLCEDCRTLTIVCDECGVTFTRLTSIFVHAQGKRDYQHVWCSKHCQGKWLGNNHGFVVHPEHRKGVSRLKKRITSNAKTKV